MIMVGCFALLGSGSGFFLSGSGWPNVPDPNTYHYAFELLEENSCDEEYEEKREQEEQQGCIKFLIQLVGRGLEFIKSDEEELWRGEGNILAVGKNITWKKGKGKQYYLV